MIKICVFCNKEYEVTRGCAIKKSKYCSPSCHHSFWLKKGNKSGKFLGNKLSLGKKIRENETLSNEQRQIVFGTLLGDASIDLSRAGSSSLRYQHSEKNLDYVLLKNKFLQNFIVREFPTLSKARICSKINDIDVISKASYTGSTVTHQDFNEIEKLFYIKTSNGRLKIFTQEIASHITILSILFWYMDDGTLSPHKKSPSRYFINLSTNNFSYEENILIQKMFLEKFNVPASIYLIKSQNRYYIRFNSDSADILMNLFSTFGKYIPASMNYKFTFLKQ
jgi:hypothetical protein